MNNFLKAGLILFIESPKERAVDIEDSPYDAALVYRYSVMLIAFCICKIS